MSKAPHYVDNKTLYAALIDYRQKRKEAEEKGMPVPKIPEYIGLCIFKIATNLSNKGNFVNYSFKEEMMSDGIENCIHYLNNFDPDKSNNPFAYFTRIVWNAYILRIQKEKKQTYIKYKAYENSVLVGGAADLNMSDSKDSTEMNVNDNMNAFISEYEKKLNEKKPPKKKGIEVFIEGD
jgi:hypothetical protein